MHLIYFQQGTRQQNKMNKGLVFILYIFMDEIWLQQLYQFNHYFNMKSAGMNSLPQFLLTWLAF